MNNKDSITVSEATDMLHLKSEETVRRYIRAGHRAGNELEKIRKIKDKGNDAFFSLCTVPNRTPYLITYDSMVLFLQRKFGKSVKEAEQIINTYKAVLDTKDISRSIIATSGALAGAAGGSSIGGVVTSAVIGVAAGIATTLYKNKKKRQRTFENSKSSITEQLELLIKDKKEIEKILQEHEDDIDRINNNIELMKKKFEEQKQIYEEALKELNESKEMYQKELNQVIATFKEKSQEI